MGSSRILEAKLITGISLSCINTMRSSLYIKNTYNKFVVYDLFFKSVLCIIEVR